MKKIRFSALLISESILFVAWNHFVSNPPFLRRISHKHLTVNSAFVSWKAGVAQEDQVFVISFLNHPMFHTGMRSLQNLACLLLTHRYRTSVQSTSVPPLSFCQYSSVIKTASAHFLQILLPIQRFLFWEEFFGEKMCMFTPSDS